jgi:two-component system chemotaxis response regulator CheY
MVSGSFQGPVERERTMKVLIVEDDRLSAMVMENFLEPYGKCDLAVDGYQALDLFRRAAEEKSPYDLVCLDIMMPGIDGQEVLKELRAFEAGKNIHGLDGVKVIMTTALGDRGNVLEAFRSQCEVYMVKPIDRAKLLSELKSLQLLK